MTNNALGPVQIPSPGEACSAETSMPATSATRTGTWLDLDGEAELRGGMVSWIIFSKVKNQMVLDPRNGLISQLMDR